MRKENGIPLYKEINEFLGGINSRHRTANPLLFCLRMEDTYPDTRDVMPPFRKGFYFISLISNAGNTSIHFDSSDESKLDSFLVFQSPGHIYSWHRDKKVNGYLIYFKKECFSFFRPEIEKEFPFFNVLQTNFFKLNRSRFREYAPLFEDVFSAYGDVFNNQYQVPYLKLLVLLYQLKDFTNAFSQWQQGFSTPQQTLFQKYLQLVNNFYIEKRTVVEYAELLNITAHHLSQSLKKVSDRNALSFINDRLLSEAKTFIKFTDLDIAEIAYQLNFSDPANFGKFFKKHAGMTPLEFRKMT